MRTHLTPGFGLLLLALSFWGGPALANFCKGNYVDQVHRTEARELENQRYSSGNDCSTSGTTTCYVGTRDYNARVIACNRKRDVKPFKLGPIKDVPLVHKGAGKHLDDRNATERRFARNLEPRMISGQMQYFGAAPKWYGYILQRDNGNWIITAILDFKFPNAEKKMLHLPVHIAARLSTTPGGPQLFDTICRTVSSGKSDEGRILWKGSDEDLRACRVKRFRQLFLIDDLDRTDLDYIDENLGFTTSRPATEWLMHYWRAVVETLWSRQDGSFQLNVEIANFAGRDGEIDQEDLELFRRNDVVFEVELHHREGRSNNMYRPITVAGVKIYKAIYAGLYPSGVAHEFGHSLGLDDEYAQRKNPRAERDCDVQSGFNEAEQFAYAMCDSWHVSDDKLQQDTVKSIYPWLVTQRYSIGLEIKGCKSNDQCLDGQYCKKTILSKNRCVALKRIGDNCTADKQCGGNAVCKPKPFGKCIVEGSKQLGEACLNNPECATDRCHQGQCVCANDNDCDGNQWCDKGTLTIGANGCKALKANNKGCTRKEQCASGRCYLGSCKPEDECKSDPECSKNEYCDKGTLTVGVNQCVAKKSNGKGCTRKEQCASGRCNLGFCAKEKECSRDRDCDRGEYCDKGTAGIGKNQCKAKKRQGISCSRKNQCQSGCCKIHNFKMQCRPSSKCN